MDKRYQIFVSSTFADLKEERQIIMRTLMEMGHFPSGMEFFSAIDEEQWPFIEKVIDDSDYYVLILGGRYGSLADAEISYTEKEFDYAKNNNKKIIALVHGNLESLPVSKTDGDNTLSEKLKMFREKVCTGRMVKFWTKPEELAGHVALALPKTIQLFPAIGWVRANKVASVDILEQLNIFRTENEHLKAELKNIGQVYMFENISELNADHTFKMTQTDLSKDRNDSNRESEVKKTMSWEKLFTVLSGAFDRGSDLQTISNALNRHFKKNGQKAVLYKVIESEMRQILFQFEALNLIRIEQHEESSTLGINITKIKYFHAELGRKLFLETKIIRRAE